MPSPLPSSDLSRLTTAGVLLLLLIHLPPSLVVADEAIPEVDETEEADVELDEAALASAADVDEEEVTFPWLGEELYYSVRVNDSEAMRAGVRIGTMEYRGDTPYVPISGVARSRGFFDAIYPVDDRINVYLDPATNRPFRSEKRLDENNRFRTYDVDYRRHEYIAYVERFRRDRESTFQDSIPAETHNMISWLYELRRTDDIAIGDQFSYFIYDGWLLSRIELEVVAREDLLTPIGWFKTWRVDFERDILRSRRARRNDDEPPQPPEIIVDDAARHTGSIWFSRDQNMIPVKFSVDSTFGSGDVVIIRYVRGESG